MKDQSKKTLSNTSISVFLFVAAGLSLGCITAFLLRSGIYAYIFHLYQTLLSQLQTLGNRPSGFLLACHSQNLKIFSAPLVLFFYQCLEILLSSFFHIHWFSAWSFAGILCPIKWTLGTGRILLFSIATGIPCDSRIFDLYQSL